jgi:hypothetical protein
MSAANALVMYSRGSVSARRHETPAQYFKSIDPTQAKTRFSGLLRAKA